MQKSCNILVLTHPFDSNSGKPILSKLLKMLSGMFRKRNIDGNITVLTGIKLIIQDKSVNLVNITSHKDILSYVIANIKTLTWLAKNRKKFDLVFLFLNNSAVFPTLLSKLLKKKVILFYTGSSSEMARNKYKGIRSVLFSTILNWFEDINFVLADKIVVESPRIRKYLLLRSRLFKKIFVVNLFVDTNHFRVTRPISRRENLVGYVGRLSKEKGIDLLLASTKCNSWPKYVKLVVVGSGELENKIRKERDIIFLEWVDHRELPLLYNKFKLILLLSYSEGLPNVILESLSCGTPVIATDIGGIPDVVSEKCGYILNLEKITGNPCIVSKTIGNILETPKLNTKMSVIGRRIIEKEYSYEASLRKLKKVVKCD